MSILANLIFVSGIHFELVLHAALLRRQSVRPLLLRHRPCRPARKFRNCMFKLLQNYNHRQHENGSVSQSVASASVSESWGLPALVTVLRRGVVWSLFHYALQVLVSAFSWSFFVLMDQKPYFPFLWWQSYLSHAVSMIPDFTCAVLSVTRLALVVAVWKRLVRSLVTGWTLVPTKHATTWWLPQPKLFLELSCFYGWRTILRLFLHRPVKFATHPPIGAGSAVLCTQMAPVLKYDALEL